MRERMFTQLEDGAVVDKRFGKPENLDHKQNDAPGHRNPAVGIWNGAGHAPAEVYQGRKRTQEQQHVAEKDLARLGVKPPGLFPVAVFEKMVVCPDMLLLEPLLDFLQSKYDKQQHEYRGRKYAPSNVRPAAGDNLEVRRRRIDKRDFCNVLALEDMLRELARKREVFVRQEFFRRRIVLHHRGFFLLVREAPNGITQVERIEQRVPDLHALKIDLAVARGFAEAAFGNENRSAAPDDFTQLRAVIFPVRRGIEMERVHHVLELQRVLHRLLNFAVKVRRTNKD